MKFTSTFLGIFFVFSMQLLKAQTLPLGLLHTIEDTYRRQQLLGVEQTGSSLMIRPIVLRDDQDMELDNGAKPFSVQQLRTKLYQNDNGKIAVYALPLVLQQQVNSRAPYGLNDNNMIQTKGYQAMLSGGLYAKVGPLSIQLRPSFVYAQNSSYKGPEENERDTYLRDAYIKQVYNKIDRPSNFGNGSYSELDWGQSSIRLNFDPISFGLSTENLWWGPGMQNSLLMSNNASGFKHLTLNTTRPIKTYIGSFEAQIIGGRLDGSGIASPSGSLIRAKPNDWRYLSGIVATYQPKWIPNLFLGIDRTFMVYRADMGNSFGDYFPFFSGLDKLGAGIDKNTNVYTEDLKKRDQYASVFAKWVMPESKAEVYVQYGRNDHAANIRDLTLEPEHSRAYIVGFRKLVSLRPKDEYLQLGIELTQLETPKTTVIRAVESWYSHYQVTAGYTQRGQIIGAGIGPGSNMQSLELNWVKGLKRIGLCLDRVVHDNDFFYKALYPVSEIRRHWVDLAFGGNFAWSFERFVVNSNLTYIRSLNDQWQLYDNGSFYFDHPKSDANNLHLKVGLMYRW